MKKILILFVLVIVGFYVYNNFFFERMIVGKYINVNYGNTFISENPHVEDTLVVYANGEFYSPFYGEGEYNLEYGFRGTSIDLKSNDRMGLNTYIDRIGLIGEPRINLCSDLDQYYKKIE